MACTSYIFFSRLCNCVHGRVLTISYFPAFPHRYLYRNLLNLLRKDANKSAGYEEVGPMHGHKSLGLSHLTTPSYKPTANCSHSHLGTWRITGIFLKHILKQNVHIYICTLNFYTLYKHLQSSSEGDSVLLCIST